MKLCLLAAALCAVFLADIATASEPRPLASTWTYGTQGALPQAIARDARGRPFLYAALKNGGLAILDASAPDAAPKELAALGTRQFGDLDAMHLAQQGDSLFVALGDFFSAFGARAGLAVVNVSDPRDPKVLSVWISPEKLNGAAGIAVRGRHAFLGAMNRGVMIFDVSDPKHIEPIARLQPDVDFPVKNPGRVQHPNARGFAVAGSNLFVAYDAGGLRVLDIQDPARPREIGRYINTAMGKKQQAYNNLVIDGTTAYVAVDYAGLEILDISDPSNIRQIAWWNPWQAHTARNNWFNSPGHTNQIAIDARRRLVYLSAGDSELLVIDVSDPAHPRLAASHGAPRDKLGAWGLALDDDYAYLTYIKALIPFTGTWSGLKAIRR